MLYWLEGNKAERNDFTTINSACMICILIYIFSLILQLHEIKSANNLASRPTLSL